MGCDSSKDVTHNDDTESFGFGKRQRVFDASGQGLTSLPPTLPRSVRVLNLQGNFLTTLEKSALAHCIHLEELDISSNKFARLPECLAELPALTSLNLSNNPFCRGGLEALHSLQHLKRLNVSMCGFRALPQCLSGCTQLTSLDLSNNYNIDLSATFLGKLPVLRVLELRFCSLKGNSLPIGIQCIPGLTELSLRGNFFDFAAPNFFGRTQERLKVLDVGKCNVTSITEELAKLSALTGLDLSLNPILDFSKLPRLQELRTLLLVECDLAMFPNLTSAAKNVETLDLSGNRFMSLTNLAELFPSLQDITIATAAPPPAQVWMDLSDTPTLRSIKWKTNTDAKFMYSTRFPIYLCKLPLLHLNGAPVRSGLFDGHFTNSVVNVIQDGYYRPDMLFPQDAVPNYFGLLEKFHNIFPVILSKLETVIYRYVLFLYLASFGCEDSYNSNNSAAPHSTSSSSNQQQHPLSITISSPDTPLVPPLDVALLHYAHMVSDPAGYQQECVRVFGVAIPNTYGTLLGAAVCKELQSASSPTGSSVPYRTTLSGPQNGGGGPAGRRQTIAFHGMCWDQLMNSLYNGRSVSQFAWMKYDYIVNNFGIPGAGGGGSSGSSNLQVTTTRSNRLSSSSLFSESPKINPLAAGGAQTSVSSTSRFSSVLASDRSAVQRSPSPTSSVRSSSSSCTAGSPGIRWPPRSHNGLNFRVCSEYDTERLPWTEYLNVFNEYAKIFLGLRVHYEMVSTYESWTRYIKYLILQSVMLHQQLQKSSVSDEQNPFGSASGGSTGITTGTTTTIPKTATTTTAGGQEQPKQVHLVDETGTFGTDTAAPSPTATGHSQQQQQQYHPSSGEARRMDSSLCSDIQQQQQGGVGATRETNIPTSSNTADGGGGQQQHQHHLSLVSPMRNHYPPPLAAPNSGNESSSGPASRESPHEGFSPGKETGGHSGRGVGSDTAQTTINSSTAGSGTKGEWGTSGGTPTTVLPTTSSSAGIGCSLLGSPAKPKGTQVKEIPAFADTDSPISITTSGTERQFREGSTSLQVSASGQELIHPIPSNLSSVFGDQPPPAMMVASTSSRGGGGGGTVATSSPTVGAAGTSGGAGAGGGATRSSRSASSASASMSAGGLPAYSSVPIPTVGITLLSHIHRTCPERFMKDMTFFGIFGDSLGASITPLFLKHDELQTMRSEHTPSEPLARQDSTASSCKEAQQQLSSSTQPILPYSPEEAQQEMGMQQSTPPPSAASVHPIHAQGPSSRRTASPSTTGGGGPSAVAVSGAGGQSSSILMLTSLSVNPIIGGQRLHLHRPSGAFSQPAVLQSAFSAHSGLPEYGPFSVETWKSTCELWESIFSEPYLVSHDLLEQENFHAELMTSMSLPVTLRPIPSFVFTSSNIQAGWSGGTSDSNEHSMMGAPGAREVLQRGSTANKPPPPPPLSQEGLTNSTATTTPPYPLGTVVSESSLGQHPSISSHEQTSVSSHPMPATGGTYTSSSSSTTTGSSSGGGISPTRSSGSQHHGKAHHHRHQDQNQGMPSFGSPPSHPQQQQFSRKGEKLELSHSGSSAGSGGEVGSLPLGLEGSQSKVTSSDLGETSSSFSHQQMSPNSNNNNSASVKTPDDPSSGTQQALPSSSHTQTCSSSSYVSRSESEGGSQSGKGGGGGEGEGSARTLGSFGWQQGPGSGEPIPGERTGEEGGTQGGTTTRRSAVRRPAKSQISQGPPTSTQQHLTSGGQSSSLHVPGKKPRRVTVTVTDITAYA